ncbi:calcium-binding protein [Marinivivus vitaminiproducens]|uniref:calcium-binding protein n=1 Tax=Marinivivus vitaminiproducens TaxID=3035935 RepID=UPI00279DA914|nr:calcium-binding protein [Geminicoccaceae bacterium SCSIO 64248]
MDDPLGSPNPTVAPGVGVGHEFGNGGEDFHATPFDDDITGGSGNDRIYLYGGDDFARGGDGDDVIHAIHGGRNTLDGGAGDDHLRIASHNTYNAASGGAGNDSIEVNAPNTSIEGGAGDDLFLLGEASGGSIIRDHQGRNHLSLHVGTDKHVLERVGQSLFIHTDADPTFDQSTDVVWLDFFDSEDNTVNQWSHESVVSLTDETTDAPSSPVPNPVDVISQADDALLA